MMIDLEEIRLDSDHTGKTKRIRQGVKRAAIWGKGAPRWKKQLRHTKRSRPSNPTTLPRTKDND